MSDVREKLTYEAFGDAVRELAQTIADDGYEPDVVLSIACGDVFVAGGLAYALDCKNLHLVNVASSILVTRSMKKAQVRDLSLLAVRCDHSPRARSVPERSSVAFRAASSRAFWTVASSRPAATSSCRSSSEC